MVSRCRMRQGERAGRRCGQRRGAAGAVEDDGAGREKGEVARHGGVQRYKSRETPILPY